jgi:Na+/melibiose symporter-like transporter
MGLTGDYHERTRLFSAKSFLGNLFAMGTAWLSTLAALQFFSGSSGNLAYGMRYVSLLVAAVVAPLSFWWFFTLKEPDFDRLEPRVGTSFWTDMRRTLSNRTFLRLTMPIFALKMGFDLWPALTATPRSFTSSERTSSQQPFGLASTARFGLLSECSRYFRSTGSADDWAKTERS